MLSMSDAKMLSMSPLTEPKRLTITLDADEYTLLRALAFDEGTPPAAMARFIIEQRIMHEADLAAFEHFGSGDVQAALARFLDEGPGQQEAAAPEWVKVGQVVIDSGRLLLTDPAYAGDLEDFLQTFPDRSGAASKGDVAMLVTAGLGDGDYPVSAKYTDGKIASVRVDFIS
jgi:hypothetical protein